MSKREARVGEVLVDLREVQEIPCVRIDAQGLLAREDMQKLIEQGRIATWGCGPERAWRDVFFTYDGGEGSNAEDLPPDVWALVCEIMQRRNVKYAIVWLADV